MAIEIDHVFICSSVGGLEASALEDFGLREGPRNEHQGQGTACRRFFFSNAYLELLWVTDQSDAQSDRTRPTGLWDRWSDRNGSACPFGLGFRPCPGHQGGPLFPCWDYRPRYLPEELSIQIASSSTALTEPLLFHLPFGRRPDHAPAAHHPCSDHGIPLHEMTRIEIVSPYPAQPSPSLLAVAAAGLIQGRVGGEYRMEIGFDGESRGSSADFRPLLPLVLRW